MKPLNERSQDINALRQWHDDLYRKKIEADANLKTSNENLERLKRQAREKYGTDDLEELRAKLEEMRNENTRKLFEYHEHLTTIEQKLSEVEAEYANSGNQEAKE
jgi:hypothetical protein